jgi:hypothetical protein
VNAEPFSFVNRTLTQVLLLLLLVTGSFSLATIVQSGALGEGRQNQSDSVLKVLLGDGRRIFANQAFVQADVYFHSGYYPSVFDQKQAPTNSSHMTAAEGSQEEEEHERQMNFLGPPHDWIEGFGRHFLITEHTHLQAGQEREILPWLKLSVELDPQRIDTYTTAAYFLRKELNKPEEAEKFLHEGVRNNPGSYELYMSWAVFITRIITTTSARVMCGNWPWCAGEPRKPTKRTPICTAWNRLPSILQGSRNRQATWQMPSCTSNWPPALPPIPMPCASKPRNSKRDSRPPAKLSNPTINPDLVKIRNPNLETRNKLEIQMKEIFETCMVRCFEHLDFGF